MCTNARFITNPYTKDRIFVDCGHCESCQQVKANKRTARIRNEMNIGKIALFVHLTYDRYGHPYVKRSDINSNNNFIPIYREYRAYRDNKRRLHKVYQDEVLDMRFVIPGDIINFRYKYDGLDLKHRKGKVGVIYFPDVQNFEKRLRSNLVRNYGYFKSFKFFNCSEYGPETCRSHHHILLFIDAADENTFRSAIVSSWPYGDPNRLRDNIKIATNAASYVSSYVNCGSSFPEWLRVNFPPRHSYSKDFGVNKECFSLDSILSKVRQRNLSYSVPGNRASNAEYVDIPIPKYIINRFFPIFKGYRKLTTSEVYHFLQYPRDLSNRRYAYLIKELDWTKEHYTNFCCRIDHAFQRYHRLTGFSRSQYVQDFVDAWTVRSNTVLNLFYRSRDFCPDYPEPFYYDNVFEFFYKPKISPSMLRWVNECDFHPDIATLNPNEFPRRVAVTTNLVDLYHKKLKTKSVNNAVFSNIYEDI